MRTLNYNNMYEQYMNNFLEEPHCDFILIIIVNICTKPLFVIFKITVNFLVINISKNTVEVPSYIILS